VKPGVHRPECGGHDVVWWDPAILKLDVAPRLGLHYEDILSPDGDGRADESVRRYEEWKAARASRQQRGSEPSATVFIATDAGEPPPGYADRVRVIKMTSGGHPSGPRFGSLVHLVLRDASFEADRDSLLRLARTHGRLLGATDEEIQSACDTVLRALQHELLTRVRQSSKIHRELPITVRTDAGEIFEGIIDLAFLEAGRWIIADFKTDADKPDRQSRYRRQVGWYVRAMEQVSGIPASGYLLHL
jgi:ATP-dependent exoDNAse (exonuclease V) beta subunit